MLPICIPGAFTAATPLALDAMVKLVDASTRTDLNCRLPGATAAIPALLDLLLIYVLRAWYQLPSTDCGWAAALRDPGITAALAAMQDRPGEPWTVETLAREAGQSRAAFARRLGELIGQPPSPTSRGGASL